MNAEHRDIEQTEGIGLQDDVEDYDLVDDEVLSPDALSDLVLYTLDWSVQSLMERIGTTFDVNPSFQRRDAWSAERKSLYIESLMLGLPVPQVVLAEDKERKGRFIVLDGKQRLVTMKQFASPDNQFPSFRLKGLEFLQTFRNRTFADLGGSLDGAEYIENFMAQPIRTIVVRNWSTPAVLYQVFVRLNQGSLSLSPQELRQALYPNDFTRWINKRSAESTPIHQARRIKGEDFRMRDAEMLLRFVAFQRSIEVYGGNLRAFLDEACVAGGREWAERGQRYYDGLAQRCELAVTRTFEVFGERDSFLRFDDDRYIRRFNIAVFDLMTAILSDPAVTDEVFQAHKDQIRAIYEVLCASNSQFQESLQTTTKSIAATAGRIVTFAEKLEPIFGSLEIGTRASVALSRVAGRA
ncbi:DUF262 domain-containing protein [Actinoplanes sp. HUAS TT8]|uniref:DUF262 domain-containing protein n=1 Tax=Actinoplanes sp. HUAS TT8 TaxID=3447453 RepID=UPI003F52359B